MNLLARGPEQSLLAAMPCGRPSKSVTDTAVDWTQSVGYLTGQGILGNTHMSRAGLASIWGDSAVWPITPILQQVARGTWYLGQRCCTRFVRSLRWWTAMLRSRWRRMSTAKPVGHSGKTSVVETPEEEWSYCLVASLPEGFRFLGLRQTIPLGLQDGPLTSLNTVQQSPLQKVPYVVLIEQALFTCPSWTNHCGQRMLCRARPGSHVSCRNLDLYS